MYSNLIELLNPKIRKKIIKELGIDKYVLSKKLNEKYNSKVQFSEFEKNAILKIIQKETNKDYSADYLFKSFDIKRRKENISDIPELAKRIDICIKLAKDRDSLTFSEIVERSNISETTLKNYRKGKTEPNPSMINNIAKALNVMPQYLKEEMDYPIPYKFKEYYKRINGEKYDAFSELIINYINESYEISDLDEERIRRYVDSTIPIYFEVVCKMVLSDFLIDNNRNNMLFRVSETDLIGKIIQDSDKVIKKYVNAKNKKEYLLEKAEYNLQRSFSELWLDEKGIIKLDEASKGAYKLLYQWGKEYKEKISKETKVTDSI